MTAEAKPQDVDTESRRILTRHDHWSIRADVLDCTKGIVRMTELDHARRGYSYGTNFRHAVEFSRSGRTPLRPFRTASGATHETLLGRLRSVKPAPPAPAWSCGRGQPRRSNLGDCPAGPAWAVPCAEHIDCSTRVRRLPTGGQPGQSGVRGAGKAHGPALAHRQDVPHQLVAVDVVLLRREPDAIQADSAFVNGSPGRTRARCQPRVGQQRRHMDGCSRAERVL